MSDFVQKPGFGSLFKNKKENDKQPDYRGDGCCPHCSQPVRIAGWLKQGKAGTFMSLKIEPPREQKDDTPAQRRSPLGTPAPMRAAALDDDIPFAPAL